MEQPPFGTNTYMIQAEGERGVWIVDPSGDPASVFGKLTQWGREPERILLTHGHMDHWLGARAIQDQWDVPVYLDPRDFHLIDASAGRLFGLSLLPLPRRVTPYEGDTLTLGDHQWRLVDAPGHSPGHLLFLGEGHALVGDVLFRGSIGRMDLPGGCETTMKKTLEEVVLTLPLDYDILPGHGPPTTMERERRENPYLRREGWLTK
ncbi:MBL fold metallo-hydrolase [bacterium]|nr:MBL fold metallo-hydrolase [bacterium]